MPRVVTPDVYIPSLQFRYQAEIIGQAPRLKFYGKAVSLPKWSLDNGWCNDMTIKCYHFENITVKELLSIEPKNVNLVIKILSPDAQTSIYEWRLVGDIVSIDYGELDWSLDDVTYATLVFRPLNCISCFEPK